MASPSEPDSGASLDSVAASFARACREAGIDYVFVGGFAVIAWGQPRTTSDLDVLVRLDEDKIPAFVTALEDQSLETSVRDLRSGIATGSHVSVFTPDPVLTVDIKPALEAYEVDQIQAARTIELEGEAVRVARPEDTVVFKLVFGSEQDIQDARSIVARQIGHLDRERLWSVAEREDVLPGTRELVEDVEAALEAESSGKGRAADE